MSVAGLSETFVTLPKLHYMKLQYGQLLALRPDNGAIFGIIDCGWFILLGRFRMMGTLTQQLELGS